MESVLLANPIYQHSGETEKNSSLAQQASINEDQEQRRRQLDSRGEKQKSLIAKEVAHMVDEFGGNIHLKQTPFTVPQEPLLQQAQQATANVFSSAFNAGKNLFNTATSAATHAAEKAIHLGQDAAGYVSNATKDVADQAVHLGHDAADYVSTATKGATEYVSHVAQEAAHQAQDISKKMVDTTSNAAGAVTHKAKELAEGAADKAHEIADNISHFTTLVAVLAEEENERARRLISGDEARAAANAFRVSELIRDLDQSFYKQTPNLLYKTKVLEEAERRWRLNSSHSTLAESNAHSVGKLVSKNIQSFMPRYEWVRSHINTIEEKERTRRLNDPNESYAIINALAVSNKIRDLGLGFYRQIDAFDRYHSSYATTLLEELERKERIRLDKLTHARDTSSLLSDVVANNMEKFNYTTRHAAQFANEFVNILGSATKNIAGEFAHLTQDFAKTAADRVKNVANEISSYSTIMYIIALEERERARRLSDADEIIAINNAWIQSSLIRELDALYRPSSSRAVYPLSIIEEQERRWRMTTLKPSASRRVAEIVTPHLLKFELAATKMSKIEHAIETASHSKLNPNAPTFIPSHSSFSEKKIEPTPIYSLPKASGAQF